MAVYDQVFVGREYEFPHLPEEAKTIIDLGANIGLTSIFFALKYRDANILSVEPDNDNFMRLIANVGFFGGRVKPLKGAAWSRDVNLRLVKHGANKASLDSWGVRVSPEIDDKSFDVECFSMPTLIGHIDGRFPGPKNTRNQIFNEKWIIRTQLERDSLRRFIQNYSCHRQK